MHCYQRFQKYMQLEFPAVELRMQYRVVLSLMNVISDLFYRGKLMCGRSDAAPPRGLAWPP